MLDMHTFLTILIVCDSLPLVLCIEITLVNHCVVVHYIRASHKIAVHLGNNQISMLHAQYGTSIGSKTLSANSLGKDGN